MLLHHGSRTFRLDFIPGGLFARPPRLVRSLSIHTLWSGGWVHGITPVPFVDEPTSDLGQVNAEPLGLRRALCPLERFVRIGIPLNPAIRERDLARDSVCVGVTQVFRLDTDCGTSSQHGYGIYKVAERIGER